MDSTVVENASPQVHAVTKLLRAFDNHGTYEDLCDATTPDFSLQLYPLSAGERARNKEDVMTGKAAFKKLVFKLQEVVEAPGKVFAAATAEGLSSSDVYYENEYQFIFTVVSLEDGTYRVKSVKEFIDAKTMFEFRAKLPS
ncbi:hypothetical protein FISHEDRAFT_75390 [Fistulina hepatica ATCC 64428]|uniref:SnoaL-like domain-containing protein n=1 Tax=Fistulina hepatica ATCC 64428 TaxID=1128425 RepID=A0A0D7A791_9AGAR|nr:hypothetical protein FISHEDRAFT_75390 [Fistulina hepatica ATCC 64428]